MTGKKHFLAYMYCFLESGTSRLPKNLSVADQHFSDTLNSESSAQPRPKTDCLK